MEFRLFPFNEVPEVVSLGLGRDGFSEQRENGWKIVVIENKAIDYLGPLPRGFDKKYQICQLGVKPGRRLPMRPFSPSRWPWSLIRTMTVFFIRSICSIFWRKYPNQVSTIVTSPA